MGVTSQLMQKPKESQWKVVLTPKNSLQIEKGHKEILNIYRGIDIFRLSLTQTSFMQVTKRIGDPLRL